MADRSPSPPSSKTPRLQKSIAISNPNVFSDEYALDEIEPIADDTPPRRHASATEPRVSSSAIEPTIVTPTAVRASTASLQREFARGSNPLRRRYEQEQPISQASDADLTRSTSTAHASVRTISTIGLPRAQSPYQGATGPSHPYGMYAQDVSLSRNPSIATTTTLRRPERSYSGPGGPSQPYGMYAQNTVPEDSDGQSLGPHLSVLPSGTPRGEGYQRRLGPDGEDVDDLIGPDGHLEQLPPYTRYANGIPPKSDVAATTFRTAPSNERPESPDAMHIAAPGPITSNLHSDQTLLESNSPVAENSDPPHILNPFEDDSTQDTPHSSVDALSKEESGSFKERVRAKGGRKVCCGLMPCWLLAFVIIVLCLAVLLGGIVGGAVAHHSGIRHTPPPLPQPQNSSNGEPNVVTTTTLADATPIPTPPNLPALPTGSYIINLQNPSYTSNTCLPQGQNFAWDCSIGADLGLSVSMSQGGPIVSITYQQDPNAPIRYGAQPPTLSGPANLVLMKDKDAWDKGPAYYFSQPFNKTVIVRSQDLAGLAANQKRASMWLPSTWLHRRGEDSEWKQDEIASASDQPWFCYWNNTMLEGFIYLTQDQSNSTSMSSPPSSTTATTPSSTPYPKIVKIEERRLLQNNNSQAYCQQMQILDNQRHNPVPGPNGQQIILQEVELASLTQHQYDRNNDGGGSGGGSGGAPSSGNSFPAAPSMNQVRRQAGPDSSCKCVWPGFTS